MSRIHDALKKAEEQNVAKVGSTPDFVEEHAGANDFLDMALNLVGKDGQQTPAIAKANPTGPVSLDSLLLNCAKVNWTPSKDALYLNGKDEHSPGLEEFRTLRSRMFQIRAKRPLKTLLISSAVPGEGKSFVSANLAQAFARQRGGRTLLIDADLRKPRLHQLFGAPSSPGLYEFLSGKAGEQEIIQRSNFEDLYFIPGGRVNSAAAELIGNGRVQGLLSRLSPLFNWIIVDSSPVIPVSDPTRLAEFCDGVLLVIQAGSTPHLLAERAKREFQHAPLLGVVLNQVPRRENPYYRYSYGSYGVPNA